MKFMQKHRIRFLTPVTVVFLLLGTIILAGCRKEAEVSLTEEPRASFEVFVGNTAISEYTIVKGVSFTNEAKLLQGYVFDVAGVKPAISGIKPKTNYIELDTDNDLSEPVIEISGGNITIKAPNKLRLTEAVNIFANTYLGYAFAGQERAYVLQTSDVIRIPTEVRQINDPWMAQREPIICLWKTDDARGIFSDDNVSLKSDVLSYSDDQLYEYVKMMKHCGFNGIQVTDMCSAWAGYGGYEFVHQRLRFMADAAHSMGMKFTLWVWGAEFNGYGWVDDTVVYYDYDVAPNSRENPEAHATFEKYYRIYAQLADCSDRVIMHFNDPGNISDNEDIGYYLDMFRTMCYEKNPDIDFGLNCYTQQIDLAKVKEFTGEDLTVYSTIAHDETELESMRNFRQYAGDLGFDLAIWSWNLCEMEIDQIAEMNVNAGLIADSYRYTRTNDDMMKPEYWSEMDSYHMVNLFSLYVSGQLLQNPDLDPQEILKESAIRVVGETYGEDLYEALNIIQEARTGDSWAEFKFGYPEYLLTSPDYPAEDLLRRCNDIIPKLEEMILANPKENTIPLAISPADLLSLILPHVVQIRDFAQFRVELAGLENRAMAGTGKAELARLVEQCYEPIHEYNVVVGAWGQPEANAQYALLSAFCTEYGLEIPHDPVFDYYRKQRIYGEMIAFQKKTEGCYKAEKNYVFQGGNAFGPEETGRLVDSLIADGLVKEDADGMVYLANWENYLYR